MTDLAKLSRIVTLQGPALAGLTVCVVHTEAKLPRARVVLDSFMRGLPAIGVGVDSVELKCPTDLLEPGNIHRLRTADLVLKTLHGEENRGGLVHASLKALGIRPVGHELETDILSQRKDAIKALMSLGGIRTLPYWMFDRGTAASAYAKFSEAFPQRACVVKPNASNASEGLRFCADRGSFLSAAESSVGLQMLEPYQPGRVITVGTISLGDAELTLPPLEYILSPDQRVMDEAWKLKPNRRLAKGLPDHVVEELSLASKKLHRLVFAKGFTRTDFIVDDHGAVHCLEINTNCGLGSTHDLATNFVEAGMIYEDLLKCLLISGLQQKHKVSQ